MKENDTQVGTYQLVAHNGRPIRKATFVMFSNGDVVKFTERMGKREAIRQAKEVAGR